MLGAIYQQTMADIESYSNWMAEGLHGIRTIKSYQQENWFLKRFEKNNRALILSGRREAQTAAVEDIVSSLISTVLTYGSYLIVGFFVLHYGIAAVQVPLLLVLTATVFSGDGCYAQPVGTVPLSASRCWLGIFCRRCPRLHAGCVRGLCAASCQGLWRKRVHKCIAAHQQGERVLLKVPMALENYADAHPVGFACADAGRWRFMRPAAHLSSG